MRPCLQNNNKTPATRGRREIPSQVWCTPVISACGKLGQDELELGFEANLGYTVKLCLKNLVFTVNYVA